EPLSKHLLIREDQEIRPPARAAGTGNDPIGIRKVAGRRAYRYTDPACPDPAQPNGLALGASSRAKDLRPECFRHRSSLGREREQVLYSDLQFLGEAKRPLGFRDVVSRLDSVNGLAAHPYAPRQFRRADTASAPQRGELILNAHRMLE